MSKGRIHFSVVFPQLCEPVTVWKRLTEHLASADALPNQFTLSEIVGHPEGLKPGKGQAKLILAPSDIEFMIVERALKGFSVNTGYSESSVGFDLVELSNCKNPSLKWAYFNCRIERKAKAPDDWSSLIEAILCEWPSIGAWQFLLTYQSWQWCSVKYDIYELRNGPFPPGYKTYPDPDYDGIGERRTFVDISMNPGRPKPFWPSNCYFNFYPTAEMWLGPHFWQYAKCTKEEAMAADFFIEKRDTPQYLYLKCWPEPFTRPDGEQGRMQQRLWKLFFHEDCEWPPGSGTISDEPMYGPPELMPGYNPPAGS